MDLMRELIIRTIPGAQIKDVFEEPTPSWQTGQLEAQTLSSYNQVKNPTSRIGIHVS